LNVTYDGRPTQQNGLDIRPLFELHWNVRSICWASPKNKTD
jgi:hypothetical protein